MSAFRGVWNYGSSALTVKSILPSHIFAETPVTPKQFKHRYFQLRRQGAFEKERYVKKECGFTSVVWGVPPCTLGHTRGNWAVTRHIPKNLCMMQSSPHTGSVKQTHHEKLSILTRSYLLPALATVQNNSLQITTPSCSQASFIYPNYFWVCL